MKFKHIRLAIFLVHIGPLMSMCKNIEIIFL